MIHYEAHPSVSDGCSVDHEFIAEPVDVGAAGLNGDSDQCGSGQVDTDYARSLSTLIENEIIPRLMVAHAAATPPGTATRDKAVIGPEEIEAFAPLAMQVEAETLLLHVEAIIARGVAIDTVLVDLLAPTARLLAEFWENERCDFADVTMALWRLQEVVHELSQRLPARQRPAVDGRHARLAPVAGNEHDFGNVIEDIFRRDGWLADRLGAGENRQSAEMGGGRLVRHNGIDRKF